MHKDVIIIGAGGHAKVIADIVRKSGDNLVGFLDDSKEAGTEFFDAFILGKTDSYHEYRDKEFIIAIGNNGIRQKIAEQMRDVTFYTAIHPAAVIAEGVTIGEGTCVMTNAVVNSDAKIGKHCIVNTASVVEHDNVISDYVHISPAAALAGTVTIGERTHVGIGAKVKNNTDICAEVVVGAGAVVVKNITEGGTYVGVPARKVK
ncbi:MAG: acetyltransferase [Ruminococcaceae bacterium]|nr:acetyltransferase [Oscillospiraceae bacterium]